MSALHLGTPLQDTPQQGTLPSDNGHGLIRDYNTLPTQTITPTTTLPEDIKDTKETEQTNKTGTQTTGSNNDTQTPTTTECKLQSTTTTSTTDIRTSTNGKPDNAQLQLHTEYATSTSKATKMNETTPATTTVKHNNTEDTKDKTFRLQPPTATQKPQKPTTTNKTKARIKVKPKTTKQPRAATTTSPNTTTKHEMKTTSNQQQRQQRLTKLQLPHDTKRLQTTIKQMFSTRQQQTQTTQLNLEQQTNTTKNIGDPEATNQEGKGLVDSKPTATYTPESNNIRQQQQQ
jgi:hypothetical protein